MQPDGQDTFLDTDVLDRPEGTVSGPGGFRELLHLSLNLPGIYPVVEFEPEGEVVFHLNSIFRKDRQANSRNFSAEKPGDFGCPPAALLEGDRTPGVETTTEGRINQVRRNPPDGDRLRRAPEKRDASEQGLGVWVTRLF